MYGIKRSKSSTTSSLSFLFLIHLLRRDLMPDVLLVIVCISVLSFLSYCTWYWYLWEFIQRLCLFIIIHLLYQHLVFSAKKKNKTKGKETTKFCWTSVSGSRITSITGSKGLCSHFIFIKMMFCKRFSLIFYAKISRQRKSEKGIKCIKETWFRFLLFKIMINDKPCEKRKNEKWILELNEGKIKVITTQHTDYSSDCHSTRAFFLEFQPFYSTPPPVSLI